MTTKNCLTARYLPNRQAGLSFFYSHIYGYEKKKELHPDNQVIILVNLPIS